MSTCPNIHSKEWQALEEAVGKFEAYRDYLETGDIRDPEIVKIKLQLRENPISEVSNLPSDPSIADIEDYFRGDREDPTMGISVDQTKQALGIELADKMSRALGITYEVVTRDEAREITKDAQNPWSGEPAFFVGGKVYFVEDMITSDNVFHEFSHPVVRAIAKENPELFENLYLRLSQTAEGQSIIAEVSEKYGLDPDSTYFKEEVIVKALERGSQELSGKTEQQVEFKNILNNILYIIKQFLRKVFGRGINIAKLNPNTSLHELANILREGKKIEINSEIISEEDIVAYNKEMYEQVTEDFQGMKKRDVQNIINTFYDSISNQLNVLLKNENYEELAELLTDNYLRGDFQAMKSNLKAWATTVRRASEKLQDDISESRTRVQAITNTIFRLESVMQKMYDHLVDISENYDTQEGMHKAYYYEEFLQHWYEFIDDIDKALRDNKVPGNSSIRSLVSTIKGHMDNSREIINKMYADGARDSLYDQLEPMGKTIKRRYEKMLAMLEEKGAPQERIDEIYRQYHGMTRAEHELFKKLSKAKNLTRQQQATLDELTKKSMQGVAISKEKIEQVLKGNMGDSNYFSSFLEGYLYNTDPVLGGLALYVKNALSDVMIAAQRKYNDFVEDIRDDLEVLGYNPTNLGKLGRETEFLDTIGKINHETGELELRKVWTIYNEFKNYRYDLAVKQKEMDDAYLDWQHTNSEEDRQKYINKRNEFKKFKRTYFHQEYVDEFYERQKMLEDDDIGKEAAQAVEDIFERMRALTEPNKTQMDQLMVSDELDLLWREYRQLHSRYYTNGKLKTGRDAAIAKRLREYREASRKFYEMKIRKGVFENAYFDFLQELRNSKIKEGSAEWHMRVEQWKKRNTRTVVKQEFYDRRMEIIKRIKTILSKVPELERGKLDQADVWKEILEMTDGYRDADGQVKAYEMEEGAISRIKELQEKLNDMRNNAVTRSGLTRKEASRLSFLFKKQRNKTITQAERRELTMLFNKRKSKGLNKYDMDILDGLYAELAAMSTKEATSYYLDIMNDWMTKLDITEFHKRYNITSLDKSSAEYILDPEIVNKWMEENAEFKEWFMANHVLKEYKDKTSGKMVKTYERIYVWSVVKPDDPDMMESYEIKDETGRTVDVIQGLPSLDYYSRVVKTEYRTRRIVGKTVDNQGNFLPKSREEMSKNTELSDEEKYKYINEDYERMRNAKEGTRDKNLYNLIEKLKRHHLQNQEGLAYSSRLYLDVPRYEKSGLEMITSASLSKKMKDKATTLTTFIRRVKKFFIKSADQMEDGLNHEEKFDLIRADMFDNEVTHIPISGLYDIESDDVSTDITYSMMRYMLSAERQKKLVEISPVARAIQATVNNPENSKFLDDMNRKNFMHRTIMFMRKDKNTTVRAKAINSFIEREFKGQTQADFTKNVPFLHNFANLLFKRASFSFFALNIPSALKNSLGMKFQSMIEASAGQYIDHISLQKGNVWSYGAMAELSGGEIYSRRAKKHKMQLIDAFDMIQGRAEEKFGESLSRTVAKDIVGLSWLYSPRKWVEMQAGLQLAAGMLYKEKVKRVMPDGTEKEISYIDAFETIDGQLRLKSGIDVRYGLEPVKHVIKEGDTIKSLAEKYHTTEEHIIKSLKGRKLEDILDEIQDIEDDREAELEDIKFTDDMSEEARLKTQDIIDSINRKYDRKLEKKILIIDNTQFKFVRNRMHQVANNMAGAYAKFDQPEAHRYLLFRVIIYMRRYFTTMAISRWGFSGKIWDPKPRVNPGLGDVQMGFYIQFAKIIVDTIKYRGKNLPNMTGQEKAAFMRFIVEVAQLMALDLLKSLLFGFDPDDDERYKKLRAKSGAVQIPGMTVKDPKRKFDMLGYLELHALHLLMQVRAENEQFNLFTGGLKQYNSLLDIKSVALGPTTDSYMQVWDDITKMLTGDPKGRYTRKMGPYKWQQKGSGKWINHFAKTFGITGTSLDPALAIQNFQSYQAKVRR